MSGARANIRLRDGVRRCGLRADGGRDGDNLGGDVADRAVGDVGRAGCYGVFVGMGVGDCVDGCG